MNDKSDKPLIQHSKESYGESFQAHLLEQYKLYVQSADNVSARRIASSNYLLTINTAIIALYGVIASTWGHSAFVMLIPVVGIGVSALWWLIIVLHSDLNEIKFEVVIPELEQHLPAALYQYEWQMIKRRKGKLYNPVTSIESRIPFAFILLHISLILISAYNLLNLADLLR